MEDKVSQQSHSWRVRGGTTPGSLMPQGSYIPVPTGLIGLTGIQDHHTANSINRALSMFKIKTKEIN